jgi:catechol 2,3-dioxygenase-like lactoylglutathione lyase family enzyme
MTKPVLKELHPVLPVRNVTDAIGYYSNKLGFELRFKDAGDDPGYAGVRRDSVELHLQWHGESSFDMVEKLSLRMVVGNIEALFEEYKTKDVFHANTDLRKTPWGTIEFAFYDPDMNGLTFYCDQIDQSPAADGTDK